MVQHMMKWILLVIFLFGILTSCAKDSTMEKLDAENKNLNNQVGTLAEQVMTLSDDNTRLSKSMDSIQEQIRIKDQEIDRLQSLTTIVNQAYLYPQNDATFQWMAYIEQFDSISIVMETNIYNIVEPEFLGITPASYVGILREGWAPQAMPTSLFNYIYTIGHDTYILEIYDAHTFKYSDQFYYCDGDLFALYHAFIPEEIDLLRPHNAIEAIFYSDIVSTSGFAAYLPNRIKSIARLLSEFQATEKPANSKALGASVVIRIYNHGGIVVITIYEEFVHVVYDDDETWYKGINELTPHSIAMVLSAG